jgi:hypothetical protein
MRGCRSSQWRVAGGSKISASASDEADDEQKAAAAKQAASMMEWPARPSAKAARRRPTACSPVVQQRKPGSIADHPDRSGNAELAAKPLDPAISRTAGRQHEGDQSQIPVLWAAIRAKLALDLQLPI